MNILLAFSDSDSASWVAFNFESLDLELEHHKNLHDAINFCFDNPELTESIKFGNILSVCYGEIFESGYHIENLLRKDAQFGDPESEEYDPRYRNIALSTPFQVDGVVKVKTFE